MDWSIQLFEYLQFMPKNMLIEICGFVHSKTIIFEILFICIHVFVSKNCMNWEINQECSFSTAEHGNDANQFIEQIQIDKTKRANKPTNKMSKKDQIQVKLSKLTSISTCRCTLGDLFSAAEKWIHESHISRRTSKVQDSIWDLKWKQKIKHHNNLN